jgi:type II secretory pathway component PulJ
MLMLRPRTAGARRCSRGMSLVELMVGVAVGLFVVAGASFLTVNQLGDNRRMSLEMQVQQDLRATADLIARDLRRAGYWGAAETGVWYDGGPNVANNPYSATDPSANAALTEEVNYQYSRDNPEDNSIDDDRERFGFKLDEGDHTIRMLVGGAWQALTDPNVLKVTRFDVTLDSKTVKLSCFKECAVGGTACWPTQDLRRFTVQIEGEAVSDANVKRSVSNSVRLRNDATAGACPA